MKNKSSVIFKKNKNEYLDEATEWIHLTPAQRFEETSRLWQIYLDLGGSLDPEPDPQSPFYV